MKLNINKEIIRYLFFGGLSFLVSITTYSLFSDVLQVDPLISNILSWVITVLFAYITNKKWVFYQNNNGKKIKFKEIISFFGGRIITLLIEELLLLVAINVLNLNDMLVKIISQVIVIILNYFISKFVVFNKKGCESDG